jgi:broad specificity phosphatase PhoE
VATALGSEYEVDDLFRELKSPRHILGKPYSDQPAVKDFMSWYETLFTSKKRAFDGENYDDITQRSKQILSKFFTYPENNLIVITHGMIIKTIIAALILGDNLTPEVFRKVFESLKTNNTGITKIEYNKSRQGDYGWKLVSYTFY